jgi:hypothetical protein
MSGESPTTARAALAQLEQIVNRLPADEHQSFWLLLLENTEFPLPGGVFGIILEIVRLSILPHIQHLQGNAAGAGRESETLRTALNDALTKLAKHRRPRRNADRDDKIMALHDQGLSAGKIVQKMKPDYELTDKIVNAAISRERRRRGH